MNSIRAEDGNALLEGIGFAVCAFGLVLSSGLGLFQAQQDQLALQSLVRNVMREHLLHPEQSIEVQLSTLQRLSTSWGETNLSLELHCAFECVAGSLAWLKISGNGYSATSFGVIDE